MSDHITIGDIEPRVQYSGDGTQTIFTYPFPIFSDSDLEVYLDNVLQTSGYTVSGAGNSAGGTVTLDSPAGVGVLITLRRHLAIERTTDFQESGEFRAKVINDELDREVAMIQQVNDDLGRTLHLQAFDPSVSLELPGKTTRMDKALGFDSDGSPVASTMTLSALESGATDASASAASSLVSETNAAASQAAASGSATAASSSAASAASSAAASAISASSALASENAAQSSEDNADAHATQVAADAAQVAADKVSSAADAAATAADAAQVSTDAAQVAADTIAVAAHAATASTDAINASASAAVAAAAAAGGLYSAVQEKSADYTILLADGGDLFKVDATSGTVTITLDALATMGIDSKFAVQKTDGTTNTVIVQQSGTDTINAATSVTLTDQWELYEFIGDASTGLWSGVNSSTTGISGGDGIEKTGSVFSVDLDATAPGLEFSSGKLRVKDDIRAFDMPFNAGFNVDYTGENVAVQTYGEIIVARSGRFTGEAGYMTTAPSGNAVIVDIQKNGTSIYTTLPRFSSSSTMTAGVLKTDGTEDFVSGDRITFKLTQVGSGTVGQKLYFTAKSEVAL